MQSEALVILLQETHCTDAEKLVLPNYQLGKRTLDLPVFPHPCLYVGNFNCRHADWGYDNNSPDGECLTGWASINCLVLLYNAKDAASFYSGHWNTGTNPDLAFASVGPNSRLPDRRVLEKFPRSQHRPSLITPPRFAMASMTVKRRNFRKGQMELLHCFDE